MARVQSVQALPQGPKCDQYNGTAKNMRESCPRVLNSSLFLLLLLLRLPLFRAQKYPDVDPYHMYHDPYFPIAGRFIKLKDIHRIRDDETVLQYCDGAFDLYYVFDM